MSDLRTVFDRVVESYVRRHSRMQRLSLSFLALGYVCQVILTDALGSCWVVLPFHEVVILLGRVNYRALMLICAHIQQ